MSLLKNSAAMAVAGVTSSLLSRLGPIEPDQVQAAVSLYRTLYNQHIQLLDVCIRIAGPALNPVGGTPLHPSTLATYSWCWDNLSDAANWNTAVGAINLGASPSLSADKWVSPVAGATPTFFSERGIIGPVTCIPTEWIAASAIGTGIRPELLAGNDAAHSISYLMNRGYFARTINTKFEIITGAGANEIKTVTNWGVFITTIALPLAFTYQAVLRNLSDRLRATALATPALESEVWTMLLSCSADVSQFTLDKMEVLRDPTGSPVYLPPASVSAVRDAMMTSVIDSYRVIKQSARFG